MSWICSFILRKECYLGWIFHTTEPRAFSVVFHSWLIFSFRDHQFWEYGFAYIVHCGKWQSFFRAIQKLLEVLFLSQAKIHLYYYFLMTSVYTNDRWGGFSRCYHPTRVLLCEADRQEGDMDSAHVCISECRNEADVWVCVMDADQKPSRKVFVESVI